MKNFKLLLLAILVVCTMCVLTVMAGATETVVDVANGYVNMYEEDKTTPIADENRTETELKWKVQDITVGDVTERVLTITGEDTTLNFHSKAFWNAINATTIPWYQDSEGKAILGSITKVVIEAPITKITQEYAFKNLTKVHTVVLPDTVIDCTSQSCVFASMKALTTFGPAGTPTGTIDLRNMTNLGYGAFEACCEGKNITILTPYIKNAFASNYKLFTTTTIATIKTVPGTASDVYFRETYPAWTPSKTDEKLLTADNYTVEAYTEAPVSGVSTDGFAAWDFDVVSGLLTINKTDKEGSWKQFNPKGTYATFKNAYGSYIKNIVFNGGYNKIYMGETYGAFSNLTNLETVKLPAGQRIQNDTSYGMFEGCTALKAVSFGGELVDGVADLSGATYIDTDDVKTYSYLRAMFSGCEAIEKVILPSNTNAATICADTFAGCTALTTLDIPETITTIEEGAFDAWINGTEGYSELTVTFPLDSAAAEGLESAGLLKVIAPKSELVVGGQVDQDDTNENDLVWSYDRVTKVLTISGTSTSIVWVNGETSGWTNNLNGTGKGGVDTDMIPWYAAYAAEIENVVITAPITTTPNAIFYKNHALKSVTFPAETVSLGGMAFADCKALVELKTAGADSPDNVIDLRNFTGTVNSQVFETAPANGATLWLPRTGSFNLNDVFGRTGNSYNFVVYPGSVGETSAYNMINSRAARVYGTFDYTYYTEEQAPAWYTEYMATTSYAQGTIGTTTYAVTYDFDLAKGKAVIDCNNWDKTLGTDEWKTMITTWKYAIKTIHAKANGKKVTANNGGLGDFIELPELTAVIWDVNRVQGTLKVNNNKKLEAFGSSSNITKGVLNLSGVTEIDNTGKAIYANMFANNPLFKKLVLPKAGILTIKANAFTGCTGLTSIEIPAGCAITTVEAGAFAGLENPVVIYNYADNTVTADALLASGILPEGSYIYEEAASSGEGLTSSVVFDGWKVRTSIKNGLRGVFFADSAKIEANEENGWTLQEYGALLSASSKKNSLGAKVYYDAAANTVTADAHLRTFPIYSTNEDVVLAKKLKGADVENAANTYFAVSVVNYKANYTTEVYMAGYEVWTKDGETVILYTDYETDTAHDATLKDASIYEVSMRMYMEGFINDKNDPDDIVWNTLVAGGAVTLKKDTHYVVTDTKLGEGVEMKDLDGNAFGDTFALVKIPQVTCQVSSGVLTGFTNSGTALSIFNSPYTSGKYVLVHSSIGGTTSATTAASWGNGTAGQLQSNWFSASKITSVSAAKFPNPIIKANVWGSIERVVFDTGITTLGAMPYRDCSATTYVYSEDFTKLAAQSFESTPSVRTIYRAGYPVAEGTVDLHWLTSINTSYTFDGANYVKEMWLPADAKPSTQFFKSNKALTTVWFGGGYDENGNPENRVEGVIDFTNATALTSLGSEMFSYCTSTIKTVRLSDAITAISADIFAKGSTTGVTFQQPTYKETIAAFCETNGFTYQNLVDGVWTTVEPVELEESEGWSGIIVK
ncbi:MAG: leucine-rich repeat protein [Clostridia bacterium]|nr:leucine-rich repeat protein [Clostridia bacterium]